MQPQITLWCGDSALRIREIPDESVAAVITDPPYGIAYMGQGWDKGSLAFQTSFWQDVMRVLQPGGVVKAFSATRTRHHLWQALKEAGFQGLREDLWNYASGMPHSLDVGKAIDKHLGCERTPKRVPFSGNGLMRHGGDNTRPWMERALKLGYHELPGDEPASPEAARWHGWGTNLKPAVEPLIVGHKP